MYRLLHTIFGERETLRSAFTELHPDFPEEIREMAEIPNCIVPLYQSIQKHKDGFDSDTLVELVGSSVLIEYASKEYLVTAKHVLIPTEGRRNLITFLTDQFVPISGQGKELIDHDVVIVELEAPELFHDAGYQFLGKESIYFHDPKIESPPYGIASGYPVTKNKVRPFKKILKNQRYNHFEEVISHTHELIKIRYKKRKNTSAKTLGRVVAPDPGGMSGGGLFYPGPKNTAGYHPPLLSGLLIEWDKLNSELHSLPISLPCQVIRYDFKH